MNKFSWSFVYCWCILSWIGLGFRLKFDNHRKCLPSFFSIPPDRIRNLGSYEKLLTRTAPNSNHFALSHASTIYLNGSCDPETLREGVNFVISKYGLFIVYFKSEMLCFLSDIRFYELASPQKRSTERIHNIFSSYLNLKYYLLRSLKQFRFDSFEGMFFLF